NDERRRAALGGKTAATEKGEFNSPLQYGLTGFAKAYGGFGANTSTHAATGYDFGGVGLLSGVGYKFAPELELGALIGYSYNHADLYRDLGEATDNVIRLGAYGNWQWDNFYFNTAPTFGIHIQNTERNITFMKQTAKADNTGFDFAWYNRFGYTFELPQKFFITPSYALGMAYLHNPSYTETGAAAALKVNAYDNWSLTQNLEVRVGKLFQISDRFALLPEIWGGWEHEYLSANDVTMRFAAAQNVAWSAPVTRIAADRAVFGAGLTTLISNKYELFGRYNQRLWDGGHSATFTVGIGVKF
ncbi:MAG: autotransporter outer membrane beta-barrel domain-containing protein, partial [Planctomycetota bacterium]|nr:autotransporter outer membrane beta-barrel domain-containing protein [Planctomycetota bacterium]